MASGAIIASLLLVTSYEDVTAGFDRIVIGIVVIERADSAGVENYAESAYCDWCRNVSKAGGLEKTRTYAM